MSPVQPGYDGPAAACDGLAARGLAVLRGERLVLRGLDLAVAPGGALLLQGPNGAGKSTLLRVLAGLVRPAAGSVRWNGAEVQPGDCAYLGHLDAIKPGLTVREMLRFPPCDAGPAGRLGFLPLMEVAGRLLSAGQRRRLALARVAGGRSPVWLLDEPASGLDAAALAGLGSLAEEHRRAGGVVVAATHVPLPLAGAATLRLGDAA